VYILKDQDLPAPQDFRYQETQKNMPYSRDPDTPIKIIINENHLQFCSYVQVVPVDQKAT
jgi:hypothetical protein